MLINKFFCPVAIYAFLPAVREFNIILSYAPVVIPLLQGTDSSGSRGALLAHAIPPTAQNLLIFMQFLQKFGKIVCWHPTPRGLAPPPTGNPGSAPD